MASRPAAARNCSSSSTSSRVSPGNPTMKFDLIPAAGARVLICLISARKRSPSPNLRIASGRVVRAMRRFGDGERFLALIKQIRTLAPAAGIRSNFIVGFPGETRDDVDELEQFLAAAGLDAIGVFGYSDEDGTEAATLPGQLRAEEIASRVEQLAGLADELMDQRAADRIGETHDVLIEEIVADDGAGSPRRYGGRAADHAPEVDGAHRSTSP